MHALLPFDSITPREHKLVLDMARSLLGDLAAGEARPLLRGRQLGLLCESAGDGDVDGDAALFRDAATALGAQVTHIRPSLMALGTPQEIQRTARMLGRLYDALDCQGLAPGLVEQLASDAGVPVYDSLASAWHVTAKLVELLEAEATPLDKRRAILQATLLIKR